jgi:hypothetical protein
MQVFLDVCFLLITSFGAVDFHGLSCLRYNIISVWIDVFPMVIVPAALVKIQKERQERRAKEEEERRERERQEAEELVRKMHEDACDEPPPIGASLSITEGQIESELHLTKDLDPAGSCVSPVTIVRNVHCCHTLDHSVALLGKVLFICFLLE